LPQPEDRRREELALPQLEVERAEGGDVARRAARRNTLVTFLRLT